ncbi:unnamed protein product, partial [Musa hybrid cultivar]
MGMAFSVSCRTLEDHLDDGAHAPSGRWKWTGTMPRSISLTDPSSTATCCSCCCCCCLPATTVLHVNVHQSFTFPEHNPKAAPNVYSCDGSTNRIPKGTSKDQHAWQARKAHAWWVPRLNTRVSTPY